jgi:hypothetical protein
MSAFEIEGYDELVRELDRIDTTLSRRLRRDCVTAAANVVAAQGRALCPVGPPGDDTRTPLRDTIGIVVREYGDERTLAVTGPEMPAGAHAHNVEFGHKEVVFGRRTGRRVPPHPFFRRAFDETQSQQVSATEAAAKRVMNDVGVG